MPTIEPSPADALLYLAEVAWENELDPFALTTSVARLATPEVVDPGTRFADLVDAVNTKRQFDGDPEGWCSIHDTPERAWPEVEDKLLADIDAALWNLLHPLPACVTCKRLGPRLSWRPADWPRSVFCTLHQAAGLETVAPHAQALADELRADTDNNPCACDLHTEVVSS